MKALVVSAPDARARGIEFSPDAPVVHLEDGRSLSVPLEWLPRLRDATVTDAARVAAALLATRITGSRLASPFTAREVYRNEWTGLTEPPGVQGALECFAELGWIRREVVQAGAGGRPTVRFRINPRLAGRREGTIATPSNLT